MASAKKNAKSGKAAHKPSKGSAPRAAKKEDVKQGSAKNNSKQKPSKVTASAKPAAATAKSVAKKPVPAKAVAPAKKAAVKPMPAPKGANATKAVAAPTKKKPEAAKKAEAPKKAVAAIPVKGKKDETKAGAVIAKPAKVAPPAKAAAPAKLPAAPKAVKPPKPPAAPKIPKVPKVPKLAPAKGPMEKAQRSLAATAARAAAKDKVPPTKALSAVKDAVAKQQLKNLPADAKVVVKKINKSFFHEVAAGAERIIKRGDKTTASPIPADIQNRRRGSGGEESPEELVERIERELEHQHIFKRNMLRPQLCTKCGINHVSERFTIDKELGYCDDCAEILHLGETKEARKIDFHPTLMKKEGEPAAEGEPEVDEEEDDDDEEDEKEPPGAKVP